MKDLLHILNDADVGKDFILVGGTNVALRFGHRTSDDLDFFSVKEHARLPSLSQLTQVVNGLYHVNITLNESDQIWYTVGHTNVTFLLYPFLFVDKPTTDALDVFGIPMASILDMAAIKASTIGRRAAARDYADLWAIIRNGISLSDLIERATAVFNAAGEQNFSPKLFLKQLTYHASLDSADILGLEQRLRGGITWEHITEELDEVVSKFMTNINESQTKTDHSITELGL